MVAKWMGCMNVLMAGVVLTSGAWISVARADDDYIIQMHRDAHVGDSYQLDVTRDVHSLLEQTTGGDTKRQTSDDSLKLATREEILEVSDGRRAIKVRLTIDSFTDTRGGNTQVILPRGAVITLSQKEGKTVGEQDGKPVPDAIVDPIRQLADLDDPGKTVSDDESFGTKDRKKVGDSWPIDKEKSAQSARQSTAQDIHPEDVAGSSRIMGLKTVGSIPCLEMQIELNVKTLRPQMQQGVTLDSGSSSIKGTMLLPTDLRLPPLGETLNSAVELKESVAQRGGATHVRVSVIVNQTSARSDLRLSASGDHQ